MNQQWIDFDDLPDDPEEALETLEWKLDNMVRVSQDAEGIYDYNKLVDYVDTLVAFDDVHGLGKFSNFQFDVDTYSQVSSSYAAIRSITRRASLRQRISKAKSLKSISYTVIQLDSSQRAAVHKLIEAIREKLNEIDLPEARRESLFNKLNAFAAEVDRNRTKTEALFAFGVEASRALNEMNENVKPFQQSLNRLFDIVERATDKVTALLPRDVRRQLEPPKKEDEL